MSGNRFRVMILVLAIGGGVSGAQPDAAVGQPDELAICDYLGKQIVVPPGDPAKPVNYAQWLNEALSKGLTDNAADAYEKAFKLYRPGELDLDELDQARSGPWDGLPAVADWLKANQPCLDAFRLATRQRQCFFPLRFTDSAGKKSPYAVKSPRAADWAVAVVGAGHGALFKIRDALLADAWQAWKHDNEDVLIENALSILHCARHMENQPLLVSNLMGMGCAEPAYAALRQAMSLTRDPDGLARKLSGKLNATTDPPLNVSQLRYPVLERIIYRDACQRVFLPGPTAGTWKVAQDVLPDIVTVARFYGNGKRSVESLESALMRDGYLATLREGDAAAAKFQAWLGKPFHRTPAEGEAIYAAAKGSANEFVSAMVPDLSHARVIAERRIASRRATYLIVRLYIYHATNHSFPNRLDELTAPDLKELRIDPFSGKDFVYRQQGTSFLLYSVGEDLKDDGGHFDPEGPKLDKIYWPMPSDVHAGS